MVKEVVFEVSALEESSCDLVKHFEIEFSEPVAGAWLISIIKKAVDEENRIRYFNERNKIKQAFHQEIIK